MFKPKRSNQAAQNQIGKYDNIPTGFIVIPKNQIVDHERGLFDHMWHVDPAFLDKILKEEVKVYSNYDDAYNAKNWSDKATTIAFIDPKSTQFSILKSYLYLGADKQAEIMMHGLIGRQLYDSSFKKATGSFNMEPNACNAQKVAALFKEYVKTGTGWRRYVFFHTSRTDSEIAAARAIIKVLDENPVLTNEAILEAINDIYIKDSKENATGIKRNSSFSSRVSYVVTQLSHGEFRNISQYNAALAPKPQQSAKPTS